MSDCDVFLRHSVAECGLSCVRLVCSTLHLVNIKFDRNVKSESATTPFAIEMKLCTHGRRRGLFQGWGDSGFFYVETIFSRKGEPAVVKFQFTNWKLREKHFSAKCQILKSKGDVTPPPSHAHAHTCVVSDTPNRTLPCLPPNLSVFMRYILIHCNKPNLSFRSGERHSRRIPLSDHKGDHDGARHRFG